MKNLRSFECIVLLLLLFICTVAQASEKITISTINYPPIEIPKFVPGLGYGIGCDLTIEAFKAVNIDVTFEFMPMVRNVWSITGKYKKKYRANLGTINWFINDHKDHLVETFDLFNFNFLFFYKKTRFPEGISYENLGELQNYKIGNVRGSSTTTIIEKAKLNTNWSVNLEQNFRKLNGDRFELALSGDISGWAAIRDLFPDTISNFATARKPLLTIPTSLVFHKDEVELIAKFRKGFDIILENGTYYKILKRYYGKNYVLDDILNPYLKEKMKKR